MNDNKLRILMIQLIRVEIVHYYCLEMIVGAMGKNTLLRLSFTSKLDRGLEIHRVKTV